MKKVLFVARNITSVNRLLDVVSVLRGDLRVEFAFTVDRGSRYAAGVEGFLRDLGVRDGLEAKVVPWAEAVGGDWDVAVAAHVNAGLRELPGRLLVLPHGAGYNRLVPSSTGGEPVAAGLSRHELTYGGAVVPDRIGVAHPEQVERLAVSCPEAVDRAVVVGDPCRDRIVANLPRRDRFRRALGAGGGRRVVAVSTTWNDRSLLAAHPDLPKRLVARLPADAYRVVLVLHPNVWTRYGPNTVLSWYADALDGGLLVVPPRYGWQAALIAADWIIGDHGSVTFYGAALDLPALVTGDGAGELDPASPLAELAGAATRWDPDGDPAAQLEAAAAGHPPGRFDDITGRGLGAPGEAAPRVRDVVYELLEMTPPEPVRVEPLRPPPAERGEVTAYRVETAVAGPWVSLRRYPYALGRFRPAGAPVEAHLAAEYVDTDRRVLESADVLIRRDPPLEEPAREWATETLRRYPGCRVVACATGGMAGLNPGPDPRAADPAQAEAGPGEASSDGPRVRPGESAAHPGAPGAAPGKADSDATRTHPGQAGAGPGEAWTGPGGAGSGAAWAYPGHAGAEPGTGEAWTSPGEAGSAETRAHPGHAGTEPGTGEAWTGPGGAWAHPGHAGTEPGTGEAWTGPGGAWAHPGQAGAGPGTGGVWAHFGGGGEWVVVVRDAGAWVAGVRRVDGVAGGVDPVVCGSVAYALLAAGRPPATVRVDTGGVELVIDFAPPPADFGVDDAATT